MAENHNNRRLAAFFAADVATGSARIQDGCFRMRIVDRMVLDKKQREETSCTS
jgi:hypothetical protein